jgi:peptidyl-prolyl cis-trans isomerase C
MKSILTILTGFLMLIAIIGLACQPKAEPKAEVAPTTAEAPKEVEAEAPAIETPPAEKAEKAETEEAVIETREAAEPAPAEANAPKSVLAAATIDGNSVAATVNGRNITEGEISARIKPQVDKMNQQLPAQLAQQYEKQLRGRALDTMVIEQLLDEQVKASNIAVTDEDVNDYLVNLASKQGMSMDDLKSLVEASGQNFDNMKQQTKKGLGYQKIMEAQWEGKINVTEEEEKKFYDENPDMFRTPEQIRASHILIKADTSEPNADPNQAKAAAKSRAEDLLKKVKEGGDFAELAKANSACSSAARGGDLGMFGRGRMVKAFEDAAFALKVGEISDVVETPFGYHIIKVTEHMDANVTPFENAREDVEKRLKRDKQTEFAKKYIDELKGKATIVYPASAGLEGEEPNAVVKPKE